jgi:hypothetical protein
MMAALPVLYDPDMPDSGAGEGCANSAITMERIDEQHQK